MCKLTKGAWANKVWWSALKSPVHIHSKDEKRWRTFWMCNVRLIVLQLSDVKPTIYTRESFDTIHLFVWVLIQLGSTLCVWIARWWLIIPPIHSSPLSSLNSFSKKKKKVVRCSLCDARVSPAVPYCYFIKKKNTFIPSPLELRVFDTFSYTKNNNKRRICGRFLLKNKIRGWQYFYGWR